MSTKRFFAGRLRLDSAAPLLAAALMCACVEGTGQQSALPPGSQPPDGRSLPFQHPDELVGKGETGMRELMGEPAFTRRDGPARVWQYAGARCFLDVFLYEEGAGAVRVAHAELRRRDGDTMSDSECIADIVANRSTS